MTARRGWWGFGLVAALFACAPATRPASDPARVACASGEIEGPLGTCLQERQPQPCDQCQVDSDCGGPGTACREIPSEIGTCLLCEKAIPPLPPAFDGGTEVDVCSQTSCENGETCCGDLACLRDDELTCASCRDQKDECASDGDCGDPNVFCLVAALPCSCDGQPHGTCLKICELTGCREGTACGSHHLCEAIPCSAPGAPACRPGYVCGAPPGSDGAGCTRAPCASAMDCGPGLTCVDGLCHESARCVSTAFP